MVLPPRPPLDTPPRLSLITATATLLAGSVLAWSAAIALGYVLARAFLAAACP
jgi:hypothetical protein